MTQIEELVLRQKAAAFDELISILNNGKNFVGYRIFSLNDYEGPLTPLYNDKGIFSIDKEMLDRTVESNKSLKIDYLQVWESVLRWESSSDDIEQIMLSLVSRSKMVEIKKQCGID